MFENASPIFFYSDTDCLPILLRYITHEICVRTTYIGTIYSVGSMYIHIGTYIHSPADDDAVVRISMTLHFDIRYVVRK